LWGRRKYGLAPPKKKNRQGKSAEFTPFNPTEKRINIHGKGLSNEKVEKDPTDYMRGRSRKNKSSNGVSIQIRPA